MDIATTVAAIVLGAAAGESVNEFLFMPLIDALLAKMPNANKEIIKRAWSCAVGIAIALEYSLDAFSLLGMRAWHAWFGIVVTGALRAALQQGPVYTVFTMMSDFARYKGGVYEWHAGWPVGCHAVALVGYQDAPGQYGGGWFIARNSSGAAWGEDGHVRIGYSQVSNQVGLGLGAYRVWGMAPPRAPEPADTWWFPLVRRYGAG